MRASEIPALREKLIEACDKRIAQGHRIVPGVTFETWVSTKGIKFACCPLGAATAKRAVEDAGAALGISEQDAVRFADGFDGGKGKSLMAKFGREFRERYVTKS